MRSVSRHFGTLSFLVLAGAFASTAPGRAGEASPGGPFQAYPWCPLPDPLTREQPDGLLAGPASVPPPSYALFRDADSSPAWGDGTAKGSGWDSLKFIPIDRQDKVYLSLGGEFRERFESWNNETFGLAPGTRGENAFWLQRLMLHLDLRVGPYVRFFFQGKSDIEEGRNDGPRPPDRDELDLHQAFVDLTVPLSPDGWATLRTGRQELGYGIGRLLDPREGPNVRLSFDGVKGIVRLQDWEVDSFWMRPVDVEPYAFDDSSQNYQLWGAYFTRPLFSKETGIDFYYLGDSQAQAAYFAGTESETRHTFGTRIHGKYGNFDADGEGAYQTGDFGPATISAWFASGEVGYSFPDAFGQPHVALKSDVFSGNGGSSIAAGGRTLGTFNPFFPRGNYFSEPSPIGEQNIIALHPQASWYPTSKLGLTFTPIFYWRENEHDGIYNFGDAPVIAGSPNQGRYVGTELFAQADYQFTPQFKVSLAYDHFVLGDFLSSQPGASDSDYVSLWATLKF